MNNKWFVLSVILLCAFLLRVGFALVYPVFPADANSGDVTWYMETAKNLAAGNGYIWPKGTLESIIPGKVGQPTSYVPPGYSLFLGSIFYFTGPKMVVAQSTNIILSLLLCVLTCLLAQKAFNNEKISLLALVFMTIAPNQIIFGVIPMTEVFLTTIFMGSILFVFKDIFENEANIIHLILGGLLLGIGSLVRGEVIFFPALVFIFYSVILKKPFLDTFRRIIIIAFFMLLIILPWTARNYFVIGYPFLVSSNASSSLLVGNNLNAFGAYTMPPKVPVVKTEIELSAKYGALAKDFIIGHPIRFLALCPLKFIRTFMAEPSFTFRRDLYAKLTCVFASLFLALAFLWYILMVIPIVLQAVKKAFWQNKVISLFVFIIIYWGLFHCLFFGGARYSFPVMPIFAILGAYSIALYREKR